MDARSTKDLGQLRDLVSAGAARRLELRPLKRTSHMVVRIHIAEELSSYPAGITDRDGPHNADSFREDVLLPKYLEAKGRDAELHVHLDGVRSFSASFLEAAFGGLIRKEDLDKGDLARRLKVVAVEPVNQRYVDAIYRYLSS